MVHDGDDAIFLHLSGSRTLRAAGCDRRSALARRPEYVQNSVIGGQNLLAVRSPYSSQPNALLICMCRRAVDGGQVRWAVNFQALQIFHLADFRVMPASVGADGRAIQVPVFDAEVTMVAGKALGGLKPFWLADDGGLFSKPASCPVNAALDS